MLVLFNINNCWYHPCFITYKNFSPYKRRAFLLFCLLAYWGEHYYQNQICFSRSNDIPLSEKSTVHQILKQKFKMAITRRLLPHLKNSHINRDTGYRALLHLQKSRDLFRLFYKDRLLLTSKSNDRKLFLISQKWRVSNRINRSCSK